MTWAITAGICDMGKIKFCSTTPLQDRIVESRSKLYRVALAWCGDEMLADDLVQETVAAGMRNCKQLRDEKSMFGWLCSIMKNNWYCYLRKQKNHDSHDSVEDQVPSDEKGPLGACQETDTIYQVRHAITELPLDQRQIISLVDLGELSYCDVSQALDIPVGTVMSRLYRARKNLLNALEKSQNEAKPVIRRENLRIIEK